MDNSPWLIPAGVTAALPLIYAFLAIAGKRAVEPGADGLVRLRMQKIYLVLGWICIVISAVAIIGMVVSTALGEAPPPWYVVVLILVPFIAFAVGGKFMLRTYRNHTVAFDHRHLIITDDRGRTVQTLWSDIADGAHKRRSGHIVLHLRDGRKVKVNPHLVGSDALFTMMRERTKLPVDRWRREC